MKLMLIPNYDGPDKGDGGIRRVVEAQKKHLPNHGFEIVNNIYEADIVATHAAEIPDVPVGKPWIVHTHGLYWSDYQWPGWGDRVNAAVIEAMKRADHVTAPSEWVAYALKRGMWLNPTVLNHGINIDEWEPGENFGYVLWNKARKDTISDPYPVNKLAEMAPNITFVTTFGNPTKNVKLIGKKPYDEAKEDVRNAGVYLATSRETFGIGTLEAMACGVPVLGWDWAGQREIIKHGVTGYLAPLNDYNKLFEGLQWCIKNRKQIAEAARADIIAHYTWEIAMAKYAELYKRVYDRQAQLSESPKVSIIVPLYNFEHILPDMVKSVQQQTMNDWEMIIVDDKSTDGSLELAKELASYDDRIHVYENSENMKLPETLNNGFSYARGRYCMNLDPDNMITPQTLKVLSDALDNDRSIHIAYGRIKFVLSDGITPAVDLTQTKDGISHWPPDFNCLAQFKHRNQIPSTCLYRREIMERTGGYRPRAKVAEDAEHWTRVVSYGFHPRKVTDAVTFIYRVHDGQKSNSEHEPDWTAWMPWVRNAKLVPWGAAAQPPKEIGRCWPVPSCEPALLTVIIPVGPGHEKHVIDALDSVEGQTFRQWHCIVINDTGEELKIPHTWAKVINTEGSQGPAVARNMGISISKTDAFVCLDADDIMEPECLEMFWHIYSREGTVVYSQWWDDKADGNIEVWDPSEWEPEKLITRGCIHATCAIYPRKLWEDVGGFDPAMKNWEDWDFQIAYALKGYCAIKIEKPLFTYRKTTGMRREDAASEMDRGEVEMKSKWPQMWDGKGKERLRMACSSCGSRKKTVRPPATPKVVKNAPPSGMVLLEYIGPTPKSLWYGKATRTKYIFGNDQSHRKKFVYAADAEHFLAIVGQFREVPTIPKEEAKEVLKPVLAGVMEG